MLQIVLEVDLRPTKNGSFEMVPQSNGNWVVKRNSPVAGQGLSRPSLCSKSQHVLWLGARRDGTFGVLPQLGDSLVLGHNRCSQCRRQTRESDGNERRLNIQCSQGWSKDNWPLISAIHQVENNITDRINGGNQDIRENVSLRSP